MNQPLTKQKCVPCEGNIKPLTREQFRHYLPMVPEWSVIEDKTIERDFRFKKVRFSLMTHAIEGLFLNDFILAAKIDRLYGSSNK